MTLLTKLPYPEILAQLRGLRGWTYWKGSLIRTYEFQDFNEVSSFIVKIKAFCTITGHYPEILIRPSKTNDTVTVKVSTSTPTVGGEVTSLDVQLGQALNNAATAVEVNSDYMV